MNFETVKNMIESYFNGQYELLKYLGEGSFAEVYLVRHKFLNDFRAIKIIKETLKPNTNIKNVFYEVMIATQLRHENIISIYDAGIISTFGQDEYGYFVLNGENINLKNDWAYFIMEYVSGGDLEEYRQSFINSDLFMPVNRVLDLMRQICLGLNTLHSSNPAIIHRDLKPRNILLNYNSKGDILVKLSDFGFAKEVTTSVSDLDIGGTRPFMAPESFFKDISLMTDIYALGVIFYLLLTNEYPYEINEFILEEILDLKPWSSQLINPSHYNDKIPDYLDDIVVKALAFNPDERYLNASELLHDIERAIDRNRSFLFDEGVGRNDAFLFDEGVGRNGAFLFDEGVGRNGAFLFDDGVGRNGAFLFDNDIEKSTQEDGIVHINHDLEEDFDYILNDSIIKAFHLAKCENKLSEAIEILENEIFRDYDVRKAYAKILQIWKSDNPDIKMISNAFSVNLRGDNYKLASYFLKEAIAYNPGIKNQYAHYLDLWKILLDLEKDRNLMKAVVDLENLMDDGKEIREIYGNVINILKTGSLDEIIRESIRLANSNNFRDASNLMEFAVAANPQIKSKFEYDLFLWKQNMKRYFKMSDLVEDDGVLSDSEEKKYADTIDYAIDLGTNDSFIACLNDGEVEVIRNYLTDNVYTSSAVYIDKDSNIIVGKRAEKAVIEDSENAGSEFKQNMGFPIPYKFKQSSLTMFPEELSAEVLKDLRKSVFIQYGVNMEHAVITVPANSNPFLTKATNDAADLAGFKTHPLIFEPLAVAMAYDDFYLRLNDYENYILDDNEIWMIYDLGGSTFKVSLIKNDSRTIEKIASASLSNLGGNYFDWAIIDKLLLPKIISDLKLDDFTRDNIKYNDVFLKLKDACEETKITLSKIDDSYISIPDLFDSYDFKYHLTRDAIKEIMEPYIKTTLDLCSDLLNEYSLTNGEIDRIILAGGSTLSPVVQDLISERFDIPLECRINPLTVVVKGAALYAGTLKRPGEEIKANEFSMFLNPNGDGLEGRVFSLDEKFSFLGFEMELYNKFVKSDRISLDIDGKFRMDSFSYEDFCGDEFKDFGKIHINIYDEMDNLLEMDEKSPVYLEKDRLFIQFLNRSIDVQYDGKTTYDDLKEEYENLLNVLNNLENIYFPDKIIGDDVLPYIEKLLDVSRKDKNIINLASAYLDYLKEIISTTKREIEFSILRENINNKLDILVKDGLGILGDSSDNLRILDDSSDNLRILGDSSDNLRILDDFEDDFRILDNPNLIVDDFNKACDEKNLDGLKEIYSNLIESYVKHNKNSVIESVFFYLRYEGIYTNNQGLSEELIRKGIGCLDSDYDALFEIINQLYDLDERNG